MALHVLTSWKSAITHEVDPTEGLRVTLRAERGGTVATSANETGEDIRTSGLIPQILNSHPDNASLTVRTVEINNERAPKLFDWTARYEWRTTEIDDSGGTNLPSGWSFRRATRKTQKPIDRDIDGHAIMTVTRESPNPPLTEEVSDIIWIFSIQGRPWNEAFLALYEDAVNADPFRGAAIGQCKIDDIQASVSFHGTDPPTMDVQISIIVARVPPAANMYELLGASAITWTAIAQPAAYYTWQKQWRAEGYKKLVGSISAGLTVDANVKGEDVVPRLHNVTTGALITNPTDAHWYTHRTKPFLSFATLFASL